MKSEHVVLKTSNGEYVPIPFSEIRNYVDKDVERVMGISYQGIKEFIKQMRQLSPNGEVDFSPTAIQEFFKARIK